MVTAMLSDLFFARALRTSKDIARSISLASTDRS